VADGLISAVSAMITHMTKRLTAGVLWFLAAGWGLNYVSVLVGLEPSLGLILSAAVGTFVGLDPFHLLWSTVAVTSAEMLDTSRSGAVRQPV
jgi:hypothetical protein